MPLIWNIDLRSEVCIQHAKCLRVNSLLAVDRPGSVRVAKISWTSIPAECSRSDRFCFANGCYKLIDGFRFFLKHLTKDMPLIWNIDLRSEVCIQHAKCLRVNSLLAVDRPGSVRVAKISWMSIPAECSRSDRFCFANGCYKLIDGFRFFLKHLTKDMPLIWNIDLRSEVCIQHAKCLRVNSLLAVDRPGSVRVAKISWTSIPAECSRSDRFCFASLTPFPSTKDLKAVFHRFHHGPMLVMSPVQSKGLIPSISRFTAISTPDMKPLLS